MIGTIEQKEGYKNMQRRNAVRLFTMLVGICLICTMILSKDSILEDKNSDSYSPMSSEDNSTEQIKVSGEVEIYTTLSMETSEILKKRLEEQFPQLKINFDCADKNQILKNKFVFENNKYDMVIQEGEYAASMLREKGMLQAYKTPEAGFLIENYDREGYWYPLGTNHVVMLYDPQKFAKNEMAMSFIDYANMPSLEYKISALDPEKEVAGLASIVALGESYGSEYYEMLLNQHIDFMTLEEEFEKLEKGETKEIIVEERDAIRYVNEGKSARIIYPSDLSIHITLNGMIINNEFNRNKNVVSCEMIMDWLLSRKGQACLEEDLLQSTRTDMNQRISYDKSLGDSSEEWKNNYNKMKEMYMDFCGKRG